MTSMGGGDLGGVTIEGGTDGTLIGNTGNRLLVDALVSSSTIPATYVAYAQGITIGNNKSMISLVNAVGSTVVVRVRRVYVINVQTTAVTGVIADFLMRRITGHSGGTPITTETMDTAIALNGSVTAITNATVAGEGANNIKRIQMSTDEWGVGAQDVESNEHDWQSYTPFYEAYDGTRPLTLRAGQGFHIRQATNSTVGTFDLLVEFTQE